MPADAVIAEAAEAPAAKRSRPTVPSVKLSSGRTIPQVGLGTWKSGPGEVKAAVKAAIECGYRHIDCAWIYGNEGEVGEAIKESGVPREELFLTSKLWNTCHHAEDVEGGCRDSLGRLGVDYVDLYLIHWPVCLKKGHAMPPLAEHMDDVPLTETWGAMEALVEKGLCRDIGVSNFSQKKLELILEKAKIPPVMNQVEGHAYLQQDKLKAFCEEKGILITAYSPLGSPDRPARVLDETDPILMEDPVLKEIAGRVGYTPAEVLIRWAVQRGTIVIPKSVTPARIEANLRAGCEYRLPEEEMAALGKMNRDLRLLKGALWFTENGPFKTGADLWDE